MPKAAKLDAKSIIKGKYEIVGDYALREELTNALHDAFHAGVDKLHGVEARKAVERDGLRNLHKHFPVEKVDLLEDFILKEMRETLYYWSYRVGHDNLQLKAPFYLDYLIIIRIHYPHLVARKGGEILQPPFPLKEKLRLAWATGRDPRLLINHIAKTIRKRQKVKEHRVAYNPTAYHGEMPTPARAHGPHIDTWYGHSYDGINLWLSIDGVNEDNTVILYPEMLGRPIDYDKSSMYLAPGFPLPKPTKVLMKPGELLLFNPEMLHGTQVNISDETRVALTTRLNPEQPRFNDDAPFNFEHWYASTDLAQKRFTKLKVFPADKYQGEPSVEPKGPLPDTRTKSITFDEPAPRDAPFAVCRADRLKLGEKLSVEAPNLKVVIARTSNGLKAYDRRCPHRAVDLADGYHDDAQLFCPGHGIAFSWEDGGSKCDAFKLKAYAVSERDGMIYLERSRSAAAKDLEAVA